MTDAASPDTPASFTECARHGRLPWLRDVLCGRCGLSWQKRSPWEPRYREFFCSCGACLLFSSSAQCGACAEEETKARAG